MDNGPIGATTLPCTVVVRGIPCVTNFTIDAVEYTQGALSVDGRLVLDRTPFPMLPPIAGVSRLVEFDLSIRARSRSAS